MDPGDLSSILPGEQQEGIYTLTEIEVDMDSQLTASDLGAGAKVLLSIEGDEDGEHVTGAEDLSRWFVVDQPPSPLPISPDVVVQRTLEDPALKQILLTSSDGKPDFDPQEEQMKIRSFLAGFTNSKRPTEQPVYQGYRPYGNGFINRTKGPGAFNASSSSQSHSSGIEADRKTKPKPKPVAVAVPEKPVEKPVAPKPEAVVAAPNPPSPSKPNSLRVIMENQIRLRRFLNDELKFDITSDLEGSRNSKSTKGPNECSKCDRKFVHASGLVRHMEKHVLDLIPSPTNSQPSPALAAGLITVVKCNFCGLIFYDPQMALEHGHVHFEVAPRNIPPRDRSKLKYKPNPDAKSLMNKVELLMGEVSLETEKLNDPNRLENNLFSCLVLGSVLQCEFCEHSFADIKEVLTHSATHLAKRRFECTACDIKMHSAKEARIHFESDCIFMREAMKSLSVSISRYFVCNVCELKFANTELLQEHRYAQQHYFPRLSSNGSRLLLPCEFCDVFFESAREVQPHNEEKHLSKKKREKESRNSTASGRQRQYLCDICGKSYTQSSHLWQHLRFHQGVKPFVCPEEKCDRKFTIRPDLNDHIRKCHTGERPFHCLVCGKRFLTGSVFYQHRLIHRGERRYECEECNKRFYRADALKNHQRIHTGEKPFSCLFCTKTFRQRGDRDKHMRARHSHLDANSRLMMQMQKFQLESAAAAKANGEQAPSGDAVATPSSPFQAEPSESGEVETQDEELQNAIKSESEEDIMSNYFVVEEYMPPTSMEDFNMEELAPSNSFEDNVCSMEEVEQEHLIMYEPGQHILSLGDEFEPGQDLITFDYKEPEEQPMQDEGYVSILQRTENARVVVMQNKPDQPLFSNSYI